MQIKPILFNTEMVRAILDGRKTQTRRIVKQKYGNTVFEMKTDKYGTRLIEIEEDVEGITYGEREDGTTWRRIRPYIEPKPPYIRGDILWVRETWNGVKTGNPKIGYHTSYWYKADDQSENPDNLWRPSIHMPKEAARIFLRVVNIRAEQLQRITKEDALAEGADEIESWGCRGGFIKLADYTISNYAKIWDKTVPKADLPRYGWAANPWVWVIEFERIEKPEGWI